MKLKPEQVALLAHALDVAAEKYLTCAGEFDHASSSPNAGATLRRVRDQFLMQAADAVELAASIRSADGLFLAGVPDDTLAAQIQPSGNGGTIAPSGSAVAPPSQDDICTGCRLTRIQVRSKIFCVAGGVHSFATVADIPS